MRFLKVHLFVTLAVIAATAGIVALVVFGVLALGWMVVRRFRGSPVPRSHPRSSAATEAPVIDITATEIPRTHEKPDASSP